MASIAGPLWGQEVRRVYLEDQSGGRIEIASLDVAPDGAYATAMTDAAFSDHLLSMRPSRCLEELEKNWCHVPYPYPIRRRIADDLTDLEHDLLFLWKGRGDYGIDMCNGIYYRIAPVDDGYRGVLHEMDRTCCRPRHKQVICAPCACRTLSQAIPKAIGSRF